MNLLRNPDESESGGGTPPASPPESSTTSPAPPTSPKVVKSGKRSSPKEEKDLELRVAELEDERDTLKGQLEGLQQGLSRINETPKHKGILEEISDFITSGWRK